MILGWLRNRQARREAQRRLAYLVPAPETAPRPLAVPERCPICNRAMTGPVHRMQSLGPLGAETILVCGICKAIGPTQSLLAAGNPAAS